MLVTIRGKILVAFLAMTTITALLAFFGIRSIESSGRLIAETYDKPLISINYARSALANFAMLEGAFARWTLERDAGRRASFARRMDDLTDDLNSDLTVVAERALSHQARSTVDDVRRSIGQWQSLRRAMMVASVDPETAGGRTDHDWPALDTRAAAVAEQVDYLVNIAAGDGFLGRQRALASVDEDWHVYVGGLAVALVLSGAVTFFLARVIIRPVKAASRAAHRIADGELDTAIPPAGSDELGALLAAMEIMRGSIRAMMQREISQRRSAQMRLVDAIEGSREGVILVDDDGKIAVANSQAAEFLSAVSERLAPGLTFSSLAAAMEQYALSPSSSPGLTERLLSPDLPATSEEQLADGRWLRISRSGTREGGLVAICSDVTPMKLREGDLQRAWDNAEAASRSKSEFLANMSHELRTPLNAVIGFSEIIAAEMFGPVGQPKYKEFADDILSSGRHLLAVINDILDIARNDAGKLEVVPEPLVVTALFEDCRKIVRTQCEQAGLTIDIGKTEEHLQIYADPVKTRQILLNLLSNAIKFTPNGGSIRLEASTGFDFVEITVTDTGIGMTAEEIPVALSPFGQLNTGLARKYEGTGLGLPLTNALVELHGGRMTIDSEPGKGSAIHVLLPKALESAVAA